MPGAEINRQVTVEVTQLWCLLKAHLKDSTLDARTNDNALPIVLKQVFDQCLHRLFRRLKVTQHSLRAVELFKGLSLQQFGLGEAGLYWDGTRHWPFASEGGHASFAPDDALQVELLQYLQQQFTHVSWERVLSGPGLHNVYTFLRDTQRGVEPAWLTEELHQGDPSAAISRAALAGTCDLCTQALDLFVMLYGAEAGNLALKVMATGGVFVGGGIAPKIVDKLKETTFMQAFCAKGRLQPVLAAMPVRVIMNDKTALYGAARCAALRAAVL